MNILPAFGFLFSNDLTCLRDVNFPAGRAAQLVFIYILKAGDADFGSIAVLAVFRFFQLLRCDGFNIAGQIAAFSPYG